MSAARPYGPEVARLYDLVVYGAEDVEADEAEVAFLERAFRDAARRPVREVLDVGCGTGPYLIGLARAGYAVTGIDSSPAMLEECRRKLGRRGLRAELREADLEALDLAGARDALLCTGSVICYLIEVERIVAALELFRRALRPGGLLVLENDNFLAQWRMFGETHRARYEGETLEVDYEDRRDYDDFRSIFHIRSSVRARQGGKEWEASTHERVRVMTVGELTAYLEGAGFAEVSAYPGFDFGEPEADSSEQMVFLALRPVEERPDATEGVPPGRGAAPAQPVTRDPRRETRDSARRPFPARSPRAIIPATPVEEPGMDAEQVARANMERLRANPYPGRGIVVGLTPDARCYVQLYWIMGRSPNSRNRVLVGDNEAVRTAPFDESQVENASLIIYECARSLGAERHVVSNGDQTATVCEALQCGATFEQALATRTFEPDAPHYTPRIAALVDLEDGACAYRLAILKSVGGSPEHCTRQFFTYETALPGYGHCIHTYAGDGDALPSFEGEPYLVETRDGINALAEHYWDALNAENRVALLAKFVETETGEPTVKIINRHEGPAWGV